MEKSESPQPTILVIVGITGDLSKRKLLPAIRQIIHAKAAPESFKILGVTRKHVTVDEILDGVEGDVKTLQDHLEIFTLDLADLNDYGNLQQHIETIEQGLGKKAQKLFYLSIPPQVSSTVVEYLGKSGISKQPDTKLLLEKPFGVDLGSARELVDLATKYFDETQIYRIDHYLAKEMTQNLVVFRQNNPLFRHTWNNEFIESIEIIASEKIGIEGRADFYEQTGALRDLIQSHLLQLAALTLAPVGDGTIKDIPARRLQALRYIEAPQDVRAEVVRGQYEGYREEVNNPHSNVETYVSLRLESNDPRWQGVPITLKTGKSLSEKKTEIRLWYKHDVAGEANVLKLRIQPNEGIEIDLWVKKPGYEQEVAQLPFNFSYEQHFESLPEAYERVFVDAIRSDRSLFTTSDEVLETWRILEPVQRYWDMNTDDLVLYSPGHSVDTPLRP